MTTYKADGYGPGFLRRAYISALLAGMLLLPGCFISGPQAREGARPDVPQRPAAAKREPLMYQGLQLEMMPLKMAMDEYDRSVKPVLDSFNGSELPAFAEGGLR